MDATTIHTPNTASGTGICSSCGEEYGLGASVPASPRPGICVCCHEAMQEQGA